MTTYGGRISTEVAEAYGGVATPGGGTYAGPESELAAHVASSPTVVLLLHMNATGGGGGSYTDSSPSAHTVTANDGAVQSAGAAKWGAGGTSWGDLDDLSIPDSADWDFGTGNFSIDFWAHYTPSAVYPGGDTRSLCGVLRSSRYTVCIEETWDTGIEEYQSSSVAGRIGGVGVISTITTGAWFHVAFWRYSGTMYIAVGGVIIQSSANATDIAGTEQLIIGPNASMDGAVFKMDELRICKGTIPYTNANFTAPSGEY